MEKSIVIAPESDKIAEMATALKIKNSFLQLGFKSKGAFFEIVQEHLPEFKDYAKSNELHNWWLLRGKPGELNKKLENVINTLRHE